MVQNRQSLLILVTALKMGLRLQRQWIQLQLFCSNWQNAYGQFSLLKQIIENIDMFYDDLTNFLGRRANCNALSLDVHDRDVKVWMSLDLMETLFKLSERNLYQQV
jgi:hypothetical protein